MKKGVTIGIIIFSFFIFIAITIYNNLTVTVNTQESSLYIESGSGLKEISSQLKDKKIISSAEYFTLYTKLKGLENKIQAGKFKIPPNINIDTLLKKLQEPEQEYIKITIPEGYTVYQIAEELEKNNLINKEKFLEIATNGVSNFDIDIDSDNILYKLEGYLFPDTYYIPNGFKEKEIIDVILKRFDEVFTDKYRERAKALGLSINEILTIASLIEKEAANDSERKTIAGVIYNRLENNMLLQIDASVIYGITKGEGHISRLLYKDLESNSVYNTYKYKGLPPGPIASPGISSIEAALYPEEHGYFYYVFDNNKHVFSKTYKEHLKNIASIRNKQNKN
jgi:UPF0755 protein